MLGYRPKYPLLLCLKILLLNSEIKMHEFMLKSFIVFPIMVHYTIDSSPSRATWLDTDRAWLPDYTKSILMLSSTLSNYTSLYYSISFDQNIRIIMASFSYLLKWFSNISDVIDIKNPERVLYESKDMLGHHSKVPNFRVLPVGVGENCSCARMSTYCLQLIFFLILQCYVLQILLH